MPTGRAEPSVRTHLRAAAAALLTAAALIAATQVYAGWRLRRYAPRIAALGLPEATRSPVLQRAFVLRPDCLPVYGSSEMAINQPTRPDRFFHRRADGFDVRLVGQAGDRCLPMLQELAALGPEARGRKVAVFLSPVWFLPDVAAASKEHTAHRQFAATFSPLQTGETLLSGELRPALKRRIAARLLDYDAVIRERSPLGVHGPVEPGGNGRGAAGGYRGAGAAAVGTKRLSDHAGTLALAGGQPGAPGPAAPGGRRVPGAPQVDGLEATPGGCRPGGGQGGAANFYSLGPGKGEPSAAESARSERPPLLADGDAEFLRRMQGSPEWGRPGPAAANPRRRWGCGCCSSTSRLTGCSATSRV